MPGIFNSKVENKLACGIEMGLILKTILLLSSILMMLSLLYANNIYAQEARKAAPVVSDEDYEARARKILFQTGGLVANADEILAESEKSWPYALPALKTVDEHVNKLISVLIHEEEDKNKKISIGEITDSLFDFSACSNLVLGSRWKRKFTPEQLKKFEAMYREMLENKFIDILQVFKKNNVISEKGIAYSPKRVGVIVDLPEGNNVPSDYIYLYLIDIDGRWRVYNIAKYNHSVMMDLGRSYNMQFNDILARNPPDVLLEKMREAVDKL